MPVTLSTLRACGLALAAAGLLSCSGAGPEPSSDLQITCPADQTVQVAPGASVSFPPPVVSGGAAPVAAPTCTPSSGGPFPFGNTRVSCTVADARRASDTCSFQLTVQPAPHITLTRFAAFGDSITRGEDGNYLRPRVVNPLSAYPTVLQRLLAERYITQTISVVNLGESQEHARSGETRLRFSRELSTRALDAVLIMEGTNDLYDRDQRDAVAAVESLRVMVRDARSRNIRPFLATVPPMNPEGSRGLPWSLVGPYNDRLRQMASEEGVTLVDVHAAFVGQEALLLSTDGLHPNDAGNARIAETFFTVLRNTLASSP